MNFKFQAVIFDFDGVLVDTSPLHAQAFKLVCQHYGLQMPPYTQVAGMNTKDAIAEILGTNGCTDSTISIERVSQEKRTLYRRLLSTASDRIYADARRFILRLDRSILLGIATGASRSNVELILRQGHLTERFSLILTAEDVEHGKPAPDIYLRFARDSRFATHATAVFEDSVSGYFSAVEAGFPCGLIRPCFTPQTTRGVYLGWFADFDEIPQAWLSAEKQGK